jgi:hypothetical protein
VAAVPLTSRIHEGLVFTNRDARSLLDKLVALVLSLARGWGRQVLLVLETYFLGAEALFHGSPLPRGYDRMPRTIGIRPLGIASTTL